MRDQGEKMFRLMRLKRLQEVRDQERQISAEKCVQYRDKINEHKQGKKECALAMKKDKMEQMCNALMYTWQKSLVEAGNAQREAQENAKNTRVRLHSSRRTADEKKLKSLERQRFALKEVESMKEVKKAEAKEVERQRLAKEREEKKKMFAILADKEEKDVDLT